MKFMIFTKIKLSDDMLSGLLADSRSVLFGESETQIDLHRFYVNPELGIFIYDDMDADTADHAAAVFHFKDVAVDALKVSSRDDAAIVVNALYPYPDYAASLFGELYMLEEDDDEDEEYEILFSDRRGAYVFFIRTCKWKFKDVEQFELAHSKVANLFDKKLVH